MNTYQEKMLHIPELQGISLKSIEEHLKLYQGYVKNANAIISSLESLQSDPETNAYTISELQRRFSFEFNGIRNHELYFSQLEGGSQSPTDESVFKKTIESQFGSYEGWISQFTALATTRGIGWAMLYWDPQYKQLVHGWVDEQHLGHLVGLIPILALDMWEHSYVADYHPSGKKQYIQDYMKNINWNVVEQRFIAAKNA